MTTLELSQTIDIVDQVNVQLQSAHKAMQNARWRDAIEQLHAVMRRLGDSASLRSYVEVQWTEVDALRGPVMMFQEAPPGFRIDLMLQLARGAAGQLEHGGSDYAAHDLEQLRTILDLLKSRLRGDASGPPSSARLAANAGASPAAKH